MSGTESPPRPASLFDAGRGLLGREAYISEEVYRLELERIFGRCWLFVGHESQVSEPNDFVVSRMGDDSVILTRNAEGEVHVLLNSCRHKGMRVCRYDEGNSPKFKCPYHAWTYSTDGSLVEAPGQLVGVQQYKESYGGKLDKVEWGLINARTETYKGLVFATWDEQAPPFLEQLGDMRYYIDALLDCRDGRPGGSVAIGGVLKWRMRTNWKAATENFIGDSLHDVSHASVKSVGVGPTGTVDANRQGTAGNPMHRMTDIGFPRWGHGCFGVEPRLAEAGTDLYPHFEQPVGPLDDPAAVDRWHREAAKARGERLQGTKQVEWPVVIGGLFPNLAFHTTFPRTIAVFHPISPDECEAWRWLLVDADAPKEVRDLNRHHFLRYSGPAGMVEQDDMENWSYLQESSRGAQARKHPYNYQASMHVEHPAENLREARTSGVWGTEGSIRTYYGGWARHLDSESWDDYLRRADAELGAGGGE